MLPRGGLCGCNIDLQISPRDARWKSDRSGAGAIAPKLDLNSARSTECFRRAGNTGGAALGAVLVVDDVSAAVIYLECAKSEKRGSRTRRAIALVQCGAIFNLNGGRNGPRKDSCHSVGRSPAIARALNDEHIAGGGEIGRSRAATGADSVPVRESGR